MPIIVFRVFSHCCLPDFLKALRPFTPPGIPRNICRLQILALNLAISIDKILYIDILLVGKYQNYRMEDLDNDIYF